MIWCHFGELELNLFLIYFHYMPKEDKPATPDMLWKELIKRFFNQFVQLCKPDLYRQLSNNPPVFLDKELVSITGKKKKGIVDLLAKVKLKTGIDEFVLFHIEVQGYREENFPSRMFSYYYRIWDRHHKPVTSIAVITPEIGNQLVKNEYLIESFGTRCHFKYSIFDIRKLHFQACIRSRNPVKIAVGIFTKGGNVPKWKKKYQVFRKLVGLGLSNQDIHLIYSFVDRNIILTKNEYEKLITTIDNDQKSKEVSMILTTFEEKALKKGIEKGIEKGAREKEMNIIMNAQKMGMSLEQIVDLTGLDKKMIQKILSQS